MGMDNATAYVANLPWRATEDDLASLFSRFGAVVDVRIIQDPATGRSRGYGFVDFTDPDSVREAVAALNGYEFGGRTLIVSPARPKPQRY
jgi:RNA recognition motif-containing protein